MRKVSLTALILAALSSAALGQTFGSDGTTTLTVNVAAEAAISVGSTAAFSLSGGTAFSGAYTGSTLVTYKIRSGGATAKITVQMAEFSPANGPSVANGNLSYASSAGSVGTGVSSTVASTTAATTVVTFGASDKSPNSGTSATVSWSIPDLPQYSIGSYQAVATFYISAT